MSQPRDDESYLEQQGPWGRQPLDDEAQRRDNWIDWLEAAVKRKKHEAGYATNEELLDDSPINRATWFRWRYRDDRWQEPLRPSLDAFCAFLGVSPDEPYAILGWGRRRAAPPRIRAMSESEIRQELREADQVLKHERLTDEDVDTYLTMVRMLTSELRLKIDRRERAERERNDRGEGDAKQA